jgi:hypothetical protein
VTVPFERNTGRSFASCSAVVSGRGMLVRVDDHRALPPATSTGTISRVEPAFPLRRAGAALALERERVLRLARDAVPLRHDLRRLAQRSPCSDPETAR